MKRMRIMGLCVVAVFAVAAFAASSASALPEYGVCVSKPETGKFKDAACTQKAGALKTEKSFEFKKEIPGEGGNEKLPLKKFTSEGGTAHLETENATKIECTHNESSGEILVKFSPTTGKQLPAKESTNVVSKFTGCQEAGKNCQNGATGVITTNKLKGPIGFIKGKGGPSPEVGQELTPIVKKGLFVEFECEGIGKIKVGEGTGKLGDCIIAPFETVDVMSVNSTLLFNGINGEFGREQVPQHFEGKTNHCNLETKLGEGPWERSVQVGTVVQTTEVALEIKAK